MLLAVDHVLDQLDVGLIDLPVGVGVGEGSLDGVSSVGEVAVEVFGLLLSGDDGLHGIHIPLVQIVVAVGVPEDRQTAFLIEAGAVGFAAVPSSEGDDCADTCDYDDGNYGHRHDFLVH